MSGSVRLTATKPKFQMDQLENALLDLAMVMTITPLIYSKISDGHGH